MKLLIRLLLAGLFFYIMHSAGTSCSSSRKTKKTDIEISSNVSKKDSTEHSGRIRFVKVNKTETGLKTNSSKNRQKQKQTETEQTTVEYEEKKIKTDAADYFPPDFVRLNDSVILVPKKTTKKTSEKKQSTETNNQAKDSIHSVDTSTIFTDEKKTVNVSISDSTGTLKKTEDTSKTVIRFQWWWLLALIPLAFLSKRVRDFFKKLV